MICASAQSETSVSLLPGAFVAPPVLNIKALDSWKNLGSLCKLRPILGRWALRSTCWPSSRSHSVSNHTDAAAVNKPTRSLSVQCFELTPCLTSKFGDRLTPFIEPGSSSAALGCAVGRKPMLLKPGRRASVMITSEPRRLGRSRPAPCPDLVNSHTIWPW
jgi:hypothetical protein